MKKLLLINPVQKKSGYLLSRYTRFSPLGLAYIAGVISKEWDIKIIDENFEAFTFEKADLVGITAFTSSINRAYEIAELYKKEGIPVALGGIHASMVTEEVLRYADSVITGEGEEIWLELLSDFEKGKLKPIYKGNQIDLSNNPPRPRRDLLDSRYLWHSIQTSRGCPFNCKFCSVTKYLGKDFRQRTAVDVLDELEEIPGKYITFVDDNLIGSTKESRDRAREIFQGMIDRKLKKRWWMQTSINATEDPELLKLAGRAGCFVAFVGFETINQSDLKEMHKGINIKIGVENYRKVVQVFHKSGIGVMGGFIIGNDYESPAYYRELSAFLLKSGIDICQISILTPLPGTDLFKEMKEEGRLKYDSFPADWNKYRLSRVVHDIKGIKTEMVYRGDNYIKKHIYTGFGLAKRMISSFLAIPNPAKFFLFILFNKAMKLSWKKSFYYERFPHTLPHTSEVSSEK